MMTQAENILNAMIDDPKYQLADHLNDITRNMVLEAIEIGICLGKNEISLQYMEFSEEPLKPQFNERYKDFKLKKQNV